MTKLLVQGCVAVERSAAGVVQRQLCCVRTGGGGAVAGQPTGLEEPHLCRNVKLCKRLSVSFSARALVCNGFSRCKPTKNVKNALHDLESARHAPLAHPIVGTPHSWLHRHAPNQVRSVSKVCFWLGFQLSLCGMYAYLDSDIRSGDWVSRRLHENTTSNQLRMPSHFALVCCDLVATLRYAAPRDAAPLEGRFPVKKLPRFLFPPPPPAL